MKTLPNRAVAIGVVLAIINPCFVNVHPLRNRLSLQSLPKLLALQLISFAIPVSLFGIAEYRDELGRNGHIFKFEVVKQQSN